MPFSGILLVNKPVGVTSFLVVSKVRRLYNLRRVGHCGTLDPFADGLLPIVVGRATRAVAYMDGFDKTYQVRIRFGRTTDTKDGTGTTLEEQPIDGYRINRLMETGFEPIREAIHSLTAIREQIPPMFSAVKVDGRPLYELARAGQDIERKSRPVTIHEAVPLEIGTDDQGLFADARIHCSKGTYIRSLAEDVGRITGLLAHAEALTRLQNGPFQLADACTWDQLLDAIASGTPLPLLPVETAFAGYPRLDVDPDRERRLIQGQPIHLPLPLPLPIGQTDLAGLANLAAIADLASPADTANLASPADPGKSLLAIFGPRGFTGLARLVEPDGPTEPIDAAGPAKSAKTEITLTAERMFVDLENHHE